MQFLISELDLRDEISGVDELISGVDDEQTQNILAARIGPAK